MATNANSIKTKICAVRILRDGVDCANVLIMIMLMVLLYNVVIANSPA